MSTSLSPTSAAIRVAIYAVALGYVTIEVNKEFVEMPGGRTDKYCTWADREVFDARNREFYIVSQVVSPYRKAHRAVFGV